MRLNPCVASLLFGFRYTPKAHLLVTDEDASDFLQSQFSNDLRPYEAGHLTYGLWLDVRGRVLADSYILCEAADRFRILSGKSAGEVIAQTLNNHIVADDVLIEQQAQLYGYSIYGAQACDALKEIGVEVPPGDTFSSSQSLTIFHGRRSRERSFELLFSSEEALKKTEAALIEIGLGQIDEETVEVERIRSGFPSVPDEVGPTDLPGEGGLEKDAVSFTKGCFLGQEVVARMHHVGRPQRGLFILKVDGPRPSVGSSVCNAAGKVLGTLRSVVGDGDFWLCTALLKTRFAEIGSQLVVGSQGAEVLQYFRD